MRSPTALLLSTLTPLLLASLACGRPPAEGERPVAPLDEVAEAYVKLVLAVGRHDADYVDAYYGPEEWRAAAAAETIPLDELRRRGEELIERLRGIDAGGAERLVVLRHRYLARQLGSLVARVRMLSGERWSFDEESAALYDAVAPHHDEAHFAAVLDTLDRRLRQEGFDDGSLIERFDAFRADFVIPSDRLDAVFRAAIDACRERTARHLELPPGESFVVEYVNDKAWSAYNWYQGGYHSLIQVNVDLPIYVDRAIDLACHEGYPGHHVYNALLEKNLVRDRGWVEFSVYPLFSPQSLIAEGTANLGIEMAFPGDERLAFERDVLFPLAGLDPERAALYYEIQALIDQLSYAGNEAARAYLDGEIDDAAAADWLSRFAAMSPQRAEQRVRFFDQYRSYVINYNLGQDLARAYVERRAGDDPEARWRVFADLLSSPRLPSDLR
ncbi:MAG: hypothetical protein D6696_11495 [Acidobacteria bacterium]|nr:MAG: hypothetical protein D6696_11495 [Acidobacteriota bacterium]